MNQSSRTRYRRCVAGIRLRAVGLVLLVAGLVIVSYTVAQDVAAEQVRAASHKSAGKAAALSLLFPGLGQRYVHNGSWRGMASLFALSEIALWTGLLSTNWQYDQRVESYTALASGRANAIVDGKDRRFFLNLASFRSSEEYLEVQLRNRAWDQLDYVAERTYQWEWQSDTDFSSYRDLRNRAESLDRRKSSIVALIVANRLIAAFSAIRATRRANRRVETVLSLGLPPAEASAPLVQLAVRW